MRKITIKEIACEMGLSRNTVAKALTGSDVVSYNTRCAVLEKAQEMGYQKLPSDITRILTEKNPAESKTVVILAHADLSVFWNEIILGISEELKNHGYKLQFNIVSEKEEESLVIPVDWDEAVGVILLSVFTEKYIEKLAQQKLPICFLDSSIDHEQMRKYGDVVFCEGKDSVHKMTESLILQGMSKIAFLGDITYCRSVRERYEGYLTAMEDAKLAIDEQLLLTKHVKNRYYVMQEVEEAIARLPYIPEAIVCANDNVALDVIRVLKQRKLRVPEDIAVTGFDNLESLTHMDPFLTTANINNQMLGRRLVQQLLFRLKYPEFSPEVVIVAAETIVRKSSQKKK